MIPHCSPDFSAHFEDNVGRAPDFRGTASFSHTAKLIPRPFWISQIVLISWTKICLTVQQGPASKIYQELLKHLLNVFWIAWHVLAKLQLSLQQQKAWWLSEDGLTNGLIIQDQSITRHHCFHSSAENSCINTSDKIQTKNQRYSVK